jgi:hypothetical protein
VTVELFHADRHDEANSRFSQFCERAWKMWQDPLLPENMIDCFVMTRKAALVLTPSWRLQILQEERYNLVQWVVKTLWTSYCGSRLMVDCVWNLMTHAQKPDFVFRPNGRLHLNRRGRQFSLLAAEVCASVVVMLDTPCSVVVWRVLATTSIHQFPLHVPLPRVTACRHISTGLHRQVKANLFHRLTEYAMCLSYCR